LTPFKRAKQTKYDLRNETLKLKVRMFIAKSNTVRKYTVDIDQTGVANYKDFVRLAQEHVKELAFRRELEVLFQP